MMGMYEDLLLRKRDDASMEGLTPLPQDKLNLLKSTFRNLPFGYVEFLEKIGFGEIGNSTYMIYSGPVDFEEIYGFSLESRSNILLFGDDFLGYCNGFDVDNCEIMEIDPIGKRANPCNMSFSEFIRKKLNQ